MTVQYATTPGTATPGQDYTAVAGTLTWGPGDVNPRTFAVPILDDSLVEGNETVGLVLSNPTGGAAIGGVNPAPLVIADNDTAPTPTPTPTPPPTPGPARIVFQSNRDGNSEIYSMNPDGSAQTRLTDHPAGDENPRISPDGTKIVWTSNRDGNAEVYSMNVDGTNVRRLTENAAADTQPTWSPDGTRIAFVSTRGGGVYDLYVMNANGTGATAVPTTRRPTSSRRTARTARDSSSRPTGATAAGTRSTRSTSTAPA